MKESILATKKRMVVGEGRPGFDKRRRCRSNGQWFFQLRHLAFEGSNVNDT